ncbi:hypothetical protein HID58_011580 [Brassica napus]|uniref:BHLH domain-containing protein n=1 Tax=Brassica napus TaxID=3708 RepID=A0ABQ8E0Q9_BRANA|nr:hypothetical protein HID58_011580 [Brassica napus]
MGDHHDFINSGSWWKVSSSSSTSSSMRASSIVSGGSDVFDEKLHSSLATDHHLQMIGLGLSSQSPVDQWNQPLLLCLFFFFAGNKRRGDSKAETSFGAMLQENLNLDATSNANAIQESDSSNHQALWRDTQINNSDFKPQLNMTSSNRGFFLEHQFSPHGSSSTDSSTVTCQGFAVDNSLYGTATTPSSSSAMFHQGAGFNLPGSSDQQPLRNHQQPNLGYGNYDQLASTWFSRSSPPKPNSPLRFSNNATFWNPAATAGNVGPTHHDASSNFFPALRPPQIHAPSFDKQKASICFLYIYHEFSITKVPDSKSNEVKRGGADQPAAKRAKSEAPSPSPASKVRKEKMGDRIAALQQLVSPFGKTDAASVLSEAIEYTKFLHQQVSALSNPYMKSGASLQHQQMSDHHKELEVSEEPDLRSRGLCLVPVSSIFPVTQDTTVDFWTPTFGGTFR